MAETRRIPTRDWPKTIVSSAPHRAPKRRVASHRLTGAPPPMGDFLERSRAMEPDADTVSDRPFSGTPNGGAPDASRAHLHVALIVALERALRRPKAVSRVLPRGTTKYLQWIRDQPSSPAGDLRGPPEGSPDRRSPRNKGIDEGYRNFRSTCFRMPGRISLDASGNRPIADSARLISARNRLPRALFWSFR